MKFIRNVTDLDDKILEKSSTASIPWWALSSQNELAFSAAYDAVGVKAPTHAPRASGHVVETIALVEELLRRGHAYPGQDGSSDVYFDVSSWPSYGTFNRDPGTVGANGLVGPAKRDERDFALWKGAGSRSGPTLPLPSSAWPSPFGEGRPGWHSSCAAMILRYFDGVLDIHAGGIDLRFPHHENELAQLAAAGLDFSPIWLHNGWVTTSGQKMSKSLGNAVSASDALGQSDPAVLRYYLGSAHYRSNLDFSTAALESAGAALERIEDFLTHSARALPGDVGADRGAGRTDELPQQFRNAMNDDLNIPAALSVLHRFVTDGNKALSDVDEPTITQMRVSVRAMTRTLGLDPDGMRRPRQSGRSESRESEALEDLVSQALDERASARAARDWARADVLRQRLEAAGISVIDSPHGATWKIARDIARFADASNERLCR